MSSLSVNYPFRDKSGDYEVSATIHNGSKVTIRDIRTDDGHTADIDDWSPDEQALMRGLALKAASELDNEPDSDYDTDILDDEEWENA